MEEYRIAEHNQCSQDAIESLTTAMSDYQEKLSSQLEVVSKQAHNAELIARKFNDSTSYKMTSNNAGVAISPHSGIYEYVTKRETLNMNAAGLAFVPYASYMPAQSRQISLMRLTQNIIQQSGEEHLLLQTPIADLIPGREVNGIFTIPNPTPIKRELHDFEAKINLLPSTIAGHGPVNFETYITNTLDYYFAASENHVFVSDNGIPNKIDGIGNLTDDGYHAMTIGYPELQLDVMQVLNRMIGTLKSEYQKEAIWLMSPSMFTAIRNVRDTLGHFINTENNSLLGFPVYCHENFNTTQCKIVFANVQEGYAMISYPGLLAGHNVTNDRKYLQYYFNRKVGGGITNKQAWVSLKINDLPPPNAVMFRNFTEGIQAGT